MADDDTTDITEPTVPSSRLREETKRRQEVERQKDAQIAELKSRLEQVEDRDKGDAERLTKELERANKRVEQAEAKATEVETARQRDQKASWLTSAAAKANFHDPDIASRMVDLEGIEDAAAAEKAVKSLAKDKSFLVKAETQQAPLQRVGIAGAEQEQAQQQGLVPREALERQWGEEVMRGLDPAYDPAAQ